MICHEEMVKQVEAIRLAQCSGRQPRDLERPVGRPALGVGRQLHQEARHEVDGAAHLRVFQEMQGHAIVVLDAVKDAPPIRSSSPM